MGRRNNTELSSVQEAADANNAMKFAANSAPVCEMWVAADWLLKSHDYSLGKIGSFAIGLNAFQYHK